MRARLLLYLYLGLKFEQKSEVGKTDVVYSWGGAVHGPGCTHGHCCQARLPPHTTTTQHRFPGPRLNIGNTSHWLQCSAAAPCPRRLVACYRAQCSSTVVRDVCSPLGSAPISPGRHMSWLAAHSKCYVGLLHGGTRHTYTHSAWSYRCRCRTNVEIRASYTVVHRPQFYTFKILTDVGNYRRP